LFPASQAPAEFTQFPPGFEGDAVHDDHKDKLIAAGGASIDPGDYGLNSSSE
jgi:hypothetical protein